MRTKVIIGGAVVLALVLFFAFPFAARHKAAQQDITVRHVKSVASAGITTMTFEIKNPTADPYIFSPYEMQVRNSNGWIKFQRFDITSIHPPPKLGSRGVASWTVDVTNLPAGSVVRFSIRVQKTLLGVEGFARRAELNLNAATGSRAQGTGLPLNPNDKNSSVYGKPKEVVTQEWVETRKYKL